MLKLGLLLGALGVGLLVLSLLPLARPAPVAAPAVAQAVAEVDQVARGRALFSAKGCAQCHGHAEVAGSGLFAGSYGATTAGNLTSYSADPEFLRRWLKDPADVRPETEMPQLGLRETESRR